MGSEGLEGRPGAGADDEATLLIRQSADKARALAEQARAEVAAIGDAVKAELKGIRQASAAEAEALRTRSKLEATQAISEAEGRACAVRVKTEQAVRQLRLQAGVALVSVTRRMNPGSAGHPALFERLRAELFLVIDNSLGSLPTDLALPSGLGSAGAPAAGRVPDADVPALHRIRRRERVPASATAATVEHDAESPGVRLFGARGERHRDPSPLAGRLGLPNGQGPYPDPDPTEDVLADGAANGGTAVATPELTGPDHPLSRLFRQH